MAGFVQRASRKKLEHADARTRPSALDAITVGAGIGLIVMDHGVCFALSLQAPCSAASAGGRRFWGHWLAR